MSSSSYTEDHLVEQLAIQLMQHELGWDVVNCYDEWSGGVSNQGRDGKREGVEILNVGFWILNGRRLPTEPRLNQFRPALSLAEGLNCPTDIFLDHFRDPAP